MIPKKVKRTRVLLVSAISILIFTTICAAKKNPWGDPKSGLILTYHMPANEVFKYQVTSDETQTIDVMGQTIPTKSKGFSTFSVQAKALKDKNLLLSVAVNDMKIDVSSGMMGNMSPDMSAIIGKSFEMTLSPLGKEIGFSGTETLEYSLTPGEKRNIDSSFKTIFPDLSDKPVKIGDTWTTGAELNEVSGGVKVHVVTSSINTLQGLETINGMECVKIEAKTTGTLDGAGQQMGADLTFKGDITGTATWYFAYKIGVFVKMTTNSASKSTIEVSAQNMTIPMTTDSSSTIELIK
ncbi:MAG: hypothetical protein L0Y73_06675 [Candidatus Aminicenantes bacterium]|nr:hypothetical protein [Candidatus Aminicenantes bacterium]